jgi:hypothetical protein
MKQIKIAEKKIGKWVDAFLTRAKAIMLKRMMDEAKQNNDPLTLKMYASDLADIMHVCYLIKHQDYVNAYEMQRDMDTEPRDLFPDRLLNALELLAYNEEE